MGNQHGGAVGDRDRMRRPSGEEGPNFKIIRTNEPVDNSDRVTKYRPPMTTAMDISSSAPRFRSVSQSQSTDSTEGPSLLPTVFKWERGGKQVFLSGSYDGWKTKTPLSRNHGDFYTIKELPVGTHQYKFFVDGQWQCDPTEPRVPNDVGSENNTVTVRDSDFEVFEALAVDSISTGHSKTGLSHSPPGDYGQNIPPRNSAGGFRGGPPILPPHLLQVILNKEIPQHCEPTLLPEPNHVMLNHLYALSIKDGVMVLSSTHRYRKKYVTQLLYKPI